MGEREGSYGDRYRIAGEISDPGFPSRELADGASKMLRVAIIWPRPLVKKFLFLRRGKNRESIAWLSLEGAGELLLLSEVRIRDFTGFNPCILSGPGQGMGRLGEADHINCENEC